MSEHSANADLGALVRRGFEALSRRDFDAAMSFYAPAAVYEAMSLGTTFEGIEAIRGFAEDWLSGYETYEMEPEEVLDLGSGVMFVVVRLTGRPIGGANALMRRRPFVFTWSEDLVTRVIASSSGIDEARADAERLARERS